MSGQLHFLKLTSVTLVMLLMAGCASKAPTQGYGMVPTQSAAASAQAQQQAQVQAAEQSVKLDTAKTYLDLIEQMQQAGQWYASLAHTDAFTREYGATPDIQLLRADALRNTQQHEAAQQLYQALLGTSLAARAHRGIGLLAASQGRYADAIRALERSRQLNPVDVNVIGDIGYAYMLAGQLELARIPVLQAAQLAPGNARVQMNLALFWLASGQETMGLQLLEKLRQPQGKQGRPLVDDQALMGLEQQLVLVRKAARPMLPLPAPAVVDSVAQEPAAALVPPAVAPEVIMQREVPRAMGAAAPGVIEPPSVALSQVKETP